VKILSLDLIAFGPFTETIIDLSAGNEGLHMIYGANEAGKSSALRALRQLFYGIPERSNDDFVHPFSKMRVGGRLRSARGEVMEILRRKGRSRTLRAADDQTTIADSALEGFLNGVDASFFAAMFGIGYEDLVAGGREIVRGGGELGRIIFAAGSGLADLRSVGDGLQAEADALFRPAGQKQKINDALGRLKQLRGRLKDAQLSGPEWARHDQTLRGAQAGKQATEEKLDGARRRLSRLQRIAEAQPVIGRRRETAQALEAVRDAVLLPEGFPERRRDARMRLEVAQREREQSLASLAALRNALSDLEDPSAVLNRAEEIEEIHQELGSQRKAARDRISIETRRNTLRTEARQILRRLREDLSIEDAGRLWIKRSDAVRIHELGAEFERIETRIEEARRKIPEHARQIAAVEDRLNALPHPRPVEALRSALAAAEDALPLEKQLAAARFECQTLVRASAQGAARLGLAVTAPDELLGLPVPAAETVRVFDERLDGIERRMASLWDETVRMDAAAAETERRLEEGRLEREVPTEADLWAARELRDRAWRLITSRLEDRVISEDEAGRILQSFPEQATLTGAYEASVLKADETADRLRREADRVAEKARLLADRTLQRERSAKLAEQVAAAQVERSTAWDEWVGLWRPLGVTARSPREMQQWVADFSVLFEKASDALKRAAQCDLWGRAVDTAFSTLSHSMAALLEASATDGETLSERYRRVRRIVEDTEELARRRDELGREKQRLSAENEALSAHVKANEAERARWRQAWAQAVQPLGLDAAARPAEAGAVMDELSSLFEKLQRAEVEQKRMDGIDRDGEAFRLKVGSLAAALAADLAGRPAEEAALELHRRLTRAREAQSRQLALQKQVEEAEARIGTAAEAIAAIELQVKAMCAEAGCEAIGELPEAERRSALRRHLEAQLGQQNEHLLQLGGGSTVEEFIREASAVDPDGIGGEIERLKSEVGRLTAETSVLDQTIGSARTELGRMDGGDEAARIACEIQSVLGGIERDVEHYARLRIAGRVLTLAMERFREKSQGPILRKASELFNRITCGSFEGLRAEHGADGHPVLVGVRRQGQETVAVEGMSDGTADQLYLSLRLAGLEHYLDANEPMPLVVDDILIKFDNARAAAALKALAELSARTQVVFFTHHRHLMELAAGNLPGSVLIEHHLN
jgi:uncharacterized protein YhaN